MARRDNPFDDWDWLGAFTHDSRPAEGCLRFLPKLVLLFLVFLILVTPVWTSYHLGRAALREKPCLLQFVAVPLTLLVLMLNALAAAIGALHLVTVVFSNTVRHNPLITVAMFLSSTMLLVLLIAFLVGRYELRLAQKLQRVTVDPAATQPLARFRHDSFATQPRRR